MMPTRIRFPWRVILVSISQRRVLSAPPQATTWFSRIPTDASCWGAGLKVVKASKSVISESST